MVTRRAKSAKAEVHHLGPRIHRTLRIEELEPRITPGTIASPTLP